MAAAVAAAAVLAEVDTAVDLAAVGPAEDFMADRTDPLTVIGVAPDPLWVVGAGAGVPDGIMAAVAAWEE